jgi:hypothetical protein
VTMTKLEKMVKEGFDLTTVVMDLEKRVEALEKATKKETIKKG